MDSYFEYQGHLIAQLLFQIKDPRFCHESEEIVFACLLLQSLRESPRKDTGYVANTGNAEIRITIASNVPQTKASVSVQVLKCFTLSQMIKTKRLFKHTVVQFNGLIFEFFYLILPFVSEFCHISTNFCIHFYTNSIIK